MTNSRIHSLAALALLLIVFGYLSWERLIAADEGFYLGAAKSWIEGKSLYHDFFFPQMPLTPWVYGIWMEVFGTSWKSSRALSAILSAGVGIIVFNHLLQYGKKTAWLGTLLLCSHSLVFSWYPTSKTFALSVILLLGSTLLIDKSGKDLKTNNQFLKFLFGGLLFGLSAETRLFFAGLAPVMIYLVIRSSAAEDRLKNIFSFVLGSFVAIIPCLIVAFQDMQTFLFNNLGYHLLRDDNQLVEIAYLKFRILRTLLGLRNADQIEGFQFVILMALAIAAQIYISKRGQKISGTFIVAVGLFFINFLPTPTYFQYFSTLIPFMIMAAAPAIRIMSGKYLFLTIALYLAFIHQDLRKYLVTGEFVLGIAPGNAPNRKVEALEKVGALINKFVPPGTRIVADWPGLLVSNHATYYSGLENQFGKQVAPRLTLNERAKYKIKTIEETRELVKDPSVDYILMEESERKIFIYEVRETIRHFKRLFNLHGVILAQRVKPESE